MLCSAVALHIESLSWSALELPVKAWVVRPPYDCIRRLR